MGQIIPENTSKKVDSLGRITLPKGMRARLRIEEGDEMEFFTQMDADGRQYVMLAKVMDAAEIADEEFEKAVALLDSRG